MKKLFLSLISICLLGAGFPIEYPKETYSMTPVQFYNWATQRNIQAEKDWYDNSINSTYPSTIKQVKGSFWGTHEVKYLPYNYVNPQYISPGPLTIINPYVHPRNLK
ncbi:MAG: hypothetical protein ACFFG0_37330 [Candidatus Thorarchaeota archaeon]